MTSFAWQGKQAAEWPDTIRILSVPQLFYFGVDKTSFFLYHVLERVQLNTFKRR